MFKQVPRARILVVDDEPQVRLLVARVLRQAGHAVVEADDGDTGLRAVRAEVPDLVLLDLHMPGMDGQTFLERLRADPRTVDVPVVVLTADTEDHVVVDCLQKGANDYVVKPFRTRELLARIGTQLVARQTMRLRAALELAGAACHEMNQPLQVLLGHCELIQHMLDGPRPLDEAAVRRSLRRIVEATDRLMRTVHALQRLEQARSVDYVAGTTILHLGDDSERH